MGLDDGGDAAEVGSSKYESNEYEIGRSRLIGRLLPASGGGRALDLGCGTGYFSRMLQQRGWEVEAVDLDRENLERAKEFSVRTYHGDALRIVEGLPDATYHLVCAFEILEHVTRPGGESLLRQILRVLKSGGRLMISTPNRMSPEGLGGYYWGEKIRGWGRWNAWDATHVHIYSSWELLRLLRRTGFCIDRTFGFWFRGRLPLGVHWSLPWIESKRFPRNRFGFNVLVCCHRRAAG